ncbi:MAG TPA: LamB/YcsF family protein [Candidatus Binatia bacterium]|nr:LamB/YcsF family protein [Candidatus Binatia bacterium]
MQFDLNCDLGEDEPLARTRLLMAHVTSANIACGGHAGDVASMRRCVRLAKTYRTLVGAHPGLCDRDNFGRSDTRIDANELELLLLQQVGTLDRIATEEHVKLHHIKLHGALYHATERDANLARAYLSIVRHWWPKVIVYAFAGGTLARYARRVGVEVWQEAFLDRNYRDDGSLGPRSEPDALLTDLGEIRKRLDLLSTKRRIITHSEASLPIRAQTLCVHSDTPGVSRIVRMLRRLRPEFSKIGRK